MTPQVKHFLANWHQAVLERDRDRLDGIIAEGCELHSPVVWKPSNDKHYLLHILLGVVETIDDFSYRTEWVDGNDIILEFTGTVDGMGLVGIDKITLNDAGHMERIEVLIRPLNTLIEFATRMREHALRYKPEAANH
ncbi:nuclear transport factor 2 family protein [Maricaulis sp. D1M11]|uniref:nuclear transport factor 2 family protein n=1 Tax=Maricaulis sp. D1M11 TaxID=3076117 RepID=UPI0039B3C56C